ncbi:tetratricopeptide repeat protein [Calidithermus terrae]|nr:tetratricopeptide repeat protein [Calidithermus terrae]
MVTILTGPLHRCMAEVIQEIGIGTVRQGEDRTAICMGTSAHAADPVLQANDFSRAVYAALGNDLLGQGADPGYIVNTLEQHADLLPNLCLVLLQAQHMPDLVRRLAVAKRLRVYLQFDHRDQAPLDLPRVRYISFQETPSFNLEAAEDDTLAGAVRRQLNNGRADRALELLVKRGPEMLPLYLDQIGWELLAQGLSKYLYTHLSALGGSLAEDPVVLRWRLASGIELGRHTEVIPQAEQVLARRDDPELRAYLGYALHLPASPGSMEHLERAVKTRRTAVTLALYGYVLQAGRYEESLSVLQAALAMAEAEHVPYLQAQISLSLAQAHYLACEPQQVVTWCEWATDVMDRYHLSNVWLRLSVLNEQATARMLLGDTVGLEEQLRNEACSLSEAGPRTRNLLTWTLAELLYLQGRYEEAMEWMERVWGQIRQRVSYGMFALGYVRCLIELGQWEKARAAADKAVTLNEPSPLVYQCQARLAAAYVKVLDNPAGAALELRDIGDALERIGQRPYSLPARCLEAYALLRAGRKAEAEQVLNRIQPIMLRFNPKAWELVVGPEHRFGSVYRLLLDKPKPLHLHFLGQMKAWLNGAPLTLHLRQAELLTALVLNPQGLSSRELAEAVYGEEENNRRLKSYIPHLKAVIPLDSEPYRLTLEAEADFEQVRRLLVRGDLRQALSLYQGPLLPGSDAPLVVEERAVLERAIREAALSSRDFEALLHLAYVTRDDLELWDLAVEHLPRIDPRRALAVARRELVLRDYGLAPTGAATTVARNVS